MRSVLMGAWPLALAILVLAGCGEKDEPAVDERTAGGLPLIDIADLVKRPQDFEEVRIAGVASPLGSKGFVIADGTGAVLTLASPLPALRVDEGERVIVTGVVRELERWRIDNLRDEIRRGGGQRGQVDPRALRQVPLEPGDPYVELDNVRREDST